MPKLFALILAAVTLVPQPQVYAPGDGVTLPKPTKQVQAEYTPEAKANASKALSCWMSW